MTRTTRPAMLLAALLMLNACSQSTPPPAKAPPLRTLSGGRIVGSPQSGKALVEKWCSTCHKPGETANDLTPSLGRLKDNPRKTPAYLRAFLAQPHAPMPPLVLSNQEIEDIISYLQADSRP